MRHLSRPSRQPLNQFILITFAFLAFYVDGCFACVRVCTSMPSEHEHQERMLDLVALEIQRIC